MTKRNDTHCVSVWMRHPVLATLEKHRRSLPKAIPRGQLIEEILLEWFALKGIPIEPEGTVPDIPKREPKPEPAEGEPTLKPPKQSAEEKERKKFVRDYVKKQREEKGYPL